MANILEVFEYNQHFIAMMNVINAAKLNPPTKGHKHHIIPKCWFKMKGLYIDNSKNNMILLSYEDHIKVHQLMLLCVKEPIMRSKMALAVHRLTKGEISNPIYWSGEFNPNFGKTRSAAIKAKISETKRNRMNDETRRRISEGRRSWTSPKMSDETKAKISEALKGTKFTDERRRHISEALKGKKRKPMSEETKLKKSISLKVREEGVDG